MNRTATTTVFAALLVAVAAPRADASSWYMKANLTEPQYQDEFDFNIPAGYRAISVQAHGTTGDPRFALVAVPDGSPWEARHGLDSDAYQLEVDDLADQSYRVVAVDAYGTFPNELYVATWVDDNVSNADWASHHRMTQDDLQTLHNDYVDDGFRMTWLSGYGTTGSNLRFAAVWVRNDEGWSADAIWNRNADGYQNDVEEYMQAGYRIVNVTAYGAHDDPRFGAVFLRPDGPNWEIQPNWKAKHGQTALQFDTFANDLGPTDYVPLCAVGYGPVNDPRYAHAWSEKKAPPVFSKTGQAAPSLASFDTVMQNFMESRKIARGALAVTKDDRLVLTKGYTYASPTTPLTQPDALFRTASISKTITATAIMQIVEDLGNNIDLDTPLKDIPNFDANGWTDTQVPDDVALRLLLQHRAGFDNDWEDNDPLTFDPMFRDVIISEADNLPLPISTTDILNYMKDFDLPFTPGMAGTDGYAYSNFGYSLLGRVIEAVSGQDYETYVLENVLCPVGAGGMQIGGNLWGDLLPGEVGYRDPMNRYGVSIEDGTTLVKRPYGSFNVTNFDAHGGWVGSALDLARFTSAFVDKANSPLLTESSIDFMWTPTPQSNNRYGGGWKQNSGAVHTHWYHNGSIVGTYAYIIRRPDGVTISVLLNQRSSDTESPLKDNDWEIKSDLMDAADLIAADPFGWPSTDLFDDDGETCGPTAPVPGDADGDGDADIDDVILVILNFGCVSSAAPCLGDTNLDGVVDVDDVIHVVLNWTPSAV